MTGKKPFESVVIASVSGMPSLGACLEHVVHQKGQRLKILAIGVAEVRGKTTTASEGHRNVNPSWFDTIGRLVAAFPLQLVFMVSYAREKVIGALTGPGDILAREA